ncbi:MAG: ABC-F family ATP-binding cassette domain-containing protein [Bacteroidales bacterium]|nr:ABC-F family ATP-binding cassette domain-containing protein [Lachnoclostridium sp.]MCM1383017.1 ABC-F family ATP-binding cassette domain-containing protein [Lachnoclostridium sp.]MCM1463928.1 ABC-F family ATP-binding cassette domain-containing protein [Bacteroidales bacterium]
MILSCQNIKKAFLENTILKNASFHIEDNEKAAIVGINGAGKTTLLRIIVGEMAADDGLVTFAKDKSYGYLAQNSAVDTKNSIYEELLSVKRELIRLENQMRSCEESMKNTEGSRLDELMKQYADLTHSFEIKGGYIYKSEIIGVLKGLGFSEEEFDKSVAALSGGQKTRVALGKLLLQKPDLIILDEPTNHLDLNSITWLETFLLNYKGAVLIVSHDRFFLDRIVTKIIEIDQGEVSVFSGNYSDYAVKKEQLRTAAWNAYVNQQRDIKHQEEVIEKLKSFNREKSIKRAESREKMLNKIEILDKPTKASDNMKFTLTPYMQSGNDVLTVEDLSKAFDSNLLFSHVNFEIKRGEHVAIIGDNGTGKTTLLKILNGLIPADSGSFCLGTNVEIGYYDQEHHVLHSDKTLFDEISDDYPYLNNTQIRNTLAAFLFTGDDVFKCIHDLSGGERGRVSLAKLMLGNANFLILDEPTNHLDIISKEILEDAINAYEGTVLYVSHDRYFINKTASRILDLTDGQFVNYIGNYDYYLEKHDAVMASLTSRASRTASQGAAASGDAALGADSSVSSQKLSDNQESAAKLDWKSQKEEQARLRKKENDLKKCEEKIAALEERTKEIETEMSDPAIGTQAARLQELAKEQEAINADLEKLYEEWETLA